MLSGAARDDSLSLSLTPYYYYSPQNPRLGTFLTRPKVRGDGALMPPPSAVLPDEEGRSHHHHHHRRIRFVTRAPI